MLRFYRPILKARHDDYPRRGRDLEQLQTIVKRYKSAAELLSDVALDPSDAAHAKPDARGGGGFVTLSTVHSAKGLEWDTLFVIWMTDGWFPSSRSSDEFDDLEEERRLLYVAATRAKRHLYFVYPLNAYRNLGPDSFPSVSRFLEPIPHGSFTARPYREPISRAQRLVLPDQTRHSPPSVLPLAETPSQCLIVSLIINALIFSACSVE